MGPSSGRAGRAVKWVLVVDWWEPLDAGLVAWGGGWELVQGSTLLGWVKPNLWWEALSRTTHAAFQTGQAPTLVDAKAAVEAAAWASLAEGLAER